MEEFNFHYVTSTLLDSVLLLAVITFSVNFGSFL